jgi:hypothetical protein
MGSEMISRYLDYKWDKVAIHGKMFASHYIVYLISMIYWRDWVCNSWWLFAQLMIEVFQITVPGVHQFEWRWYATNIWHVSCMIRLSLQAWFIYENYMEQKNPTEERFD